MDDEFGSDGEFGGDTGGDIAPDVGSDAGAGFGMVPDADDGGLCAEIDDGNPGGPSVETEEDDGGSLCGDMEEDDGGSLSGNLEEDDDDGLCGDLEEDDGGSTTDDDDDGGDFTDDLEQQTEGPTIREDIINNPEFVDENGDIRWPDNDGFAGTPKEITLEPGTEVDRFGSEDGRFTAIAGTPYENRSLPFEEGSQEYNTYEVIKPIDGVLQGETAEAFNQPGGGIQQMLPESIGYYIDNGYIRRK